MSLLGLTPFTQYYICETYSWLHEFIHSCCYVEWLLRTDHDFFIHSTVVGHWNQGRFKFGAIKNKHACTCLLTNILKALSWVIE